MKSSSLTASRLMMMSPSRRRVMPVRVVETKFIGLLFLLIIILFGFSMTYLQAQKTHYSNRIQVQGERIERLQGEIRAYRSSLAGLTSLPVIREQALEMGMAEPDRLPTDLVVTLTEAEVERAGGRHGEALTKLFAR